MILAILWTLILGVITVLSWPIPEREVVSIFASGAIDPNIGKMPEIDYYDALATIARAKSPLPKGFIPDAPPAGWTPVPALSDGLLVAVPEVGSVRFPRSMNQTEVESASKQLVEEHQKLVQAINTTQLQEFSERRRAALKLAAVLWVLPLAAIYGLGWSVGWIRRGFQRSAS